MTISEKSFKLKTTDKGRDVILYVVDKLKFESFSEDLNNVSNQFDLNVFKDKYGISPNEVISIGETDLKITSLEKEDIIELNKLLEIILPNPVMVKDTKSGKIKKSYKCWLCKDLNIPKITDHPTPISSWDCLMTRIGFPEYAIIVQVKSKNKI